MRKEKKSIFNKLLDVIYPPACMFCKHPLSPSDDDMICKDCLAHLPYTKNHGCFEAFGGAAYLIAPFLYENGVRKAIHDLKFKSKYDNARVLAMFMAGYLANIEEIKAIDLVIPVPLSRKSFAKRGFNQTLLLAKGICERLNLLLDDRVLIKVRETKRQSSLRNFEDRARNVLDAYQCISDLSGKRILLVDDIYTTGMTVYNCAKALLDAGAEKVIAATIANAHKEIGVSSHDYKGSRLIFKK